MLSLALLALGLPPRGMLGRMSNRQAPRRRWFQFGLAEVGISVALFALALACAKWLVAVANASDGEVHPFAVSLAFLAMLTCGFAAVGNLFRAGVEAAYVGAVLGVMTLAPFLLQIFGVTR